MKDRKGTKVKRILNDYIMFEDNWINENDKTLYNNDDESFSVLDFKEIKENTHIMNTLPLESYYAKPLLAVVRIINN